LHLAAIYDGKTTFLFINGELRTSKSVCKDTSCGKITYPIPSDDGWSGATPFMIGAYNNVKTGNVQSHVGSMKVLRICKVSLTQSDIKKLFYKFSSLRQSPIDVNFYWTSSIESDIPSPSTRHSPSTSREKISVLGRLKLSSKYACRFSYKDTSVRSSYAAPHSTNRYICSIPFWPAGFKGAAMSLWACDDDLCQQSESVRPLWQRMCLRKSCGYVSTANSSAYRTNGVKTVFTFTTPTNIYKFENSSANSRLLKVATLEESLAMSSARHFVSSTGQDYLLVANYGNGRFTSVHSRLYGLRLNAVSRSLELNTLQNISSRAAYEWSTCNFKNDTFMALASFMDDVRVYKLVESYPVADLDIIQVLPGTSGAVSVDCFVIKESMYLAFARYFDVETFSHQVSSRIFRYDEETKTFNPHQNISTNGAQSVQHFHGNQSFLIISEEKALSSQLLVYNVNISLFVGMQRIETQSARKASFFVVADVALYLAIAQAASCKTVSSGQDGTCSFIYRWNGTQDGGCPSDQAQGCGFHSITSPDTLLKDVSGGQALGTFESAGSLRANVSDIKYVFNRPFHFIIASYLDSVDADGIQTSITPSFVYIATLENLTNHLLAPSALATSIDQQHLYVAEHDGFQDKLSLFSINGESGHLLLNELSVSTKQGKSWDFAGHNYISSMVFSNTTEGREILYVATSFPGAIHAFSRQSETGALDFENSYLSSCGVGMTNARSLTLSADSSFLSLASYADSALIVFSRDLIDGSLEFYDSIGNGDIDWENFVSAASISVSNNLSGLFSVKMENSRQELDANLTSAVCGEHFSIGSDAYLVICGEKNGVLLFIWKPEKFVFLQRIDNASTAQCIRHFQSNSSKGNVSTANHFLAIVFSRDLYHGEVVSGCKMFRWDYSLKRFFFYSEISNTPEQSFASSLDTFELDGEIFMAVAFKSNKITTNVLSYVYKWNKTRMQFTPFQSFPTFGAVDVSFKLLPQGKNLKNLLVFVNQLETVADLLLITSSFDTLSFGSSFGSKFDLKRPREIPGYRRIGDSMLSQSAILVRDGPWSSKPADFTLVFLDQSGRAAIWRPNPEPGFRCLGHIADTYRGAESPPSSDIIRCVSEDILTFVNVPCKNVTVCSELSGEWNVCLYPASQSCNLTVDTICPTFELINAGWMSRKAGIFKVHTSPLVYEHIGMSVCPSEEMGFWWFADSALQWFHTSSRLLTYSSALQHFIEIQSLNTTGAVDVEIFSIPLQHTDAAQFPPVTRTFLILANRQSGIASYDQASYATKSYMYEWNGVNFVVNDDFSYVNTTPEAVCNEVESDCQCLDNLTFGKDFFGICTTYAAGGPNHGFCILDNACAECPNSCAVECPNSCSNDETRQEELRRAQNWNMTNGLVGVSRFRFFSVSGKHFLLIAQSLCDLGMDKERCLLSGTVQPKSAVLQWNDTSGQFGEISEGNREFALRLPAGALMDAKYLELPSRQNNSNLFRVLVVFSLTRGVLAYRLPLQSWGLARPISGFAGIVSCSDVSADSDQYIFTVSEIDKAVTVVEMKMVLDTLNRTVSKLAVKTHIRTNSFIAGPKRISASKATHSGYDIIVEGSSKQSDLICGPVPVELGVASKFLSFSSKDACQELTFKVNQISGPEKLLVDDKITVAPNGTLQFTIGHGKTGTGVFKIFAIDNGIPAAESNSQYFSITVVPVNMAPTFKVNNVSLNQSQVVGSRMQFLTDITVGTAEEDFTRLKILLVSMSNPSLFRSNPVFQVDMNRGYVLLNANQGRSGSSTITVEIQNGGGTSLIGVDYVDEESTNGTNSATCAINCKNSIFRSNPPKIIEVGSSSATVEFTVNIVPEHFVPDFVLKDYFAWDASVGINIIDNFAQNISLQQYNEFGFQLSSIASLGGFLGHTSLFQDGDGLPKLLNNGSLKFTSRRRATLIMQCSKGGGMQLNEPDIGNGAILLSFTLYEGSSNTLFFGYSTPHYCNISVLRINMAPSFSILTAIIHVFVTGDSLIFKKAFVSNISAGSQEEDAFQKVSFVTLNVSNPDLFASRPAATVDGFILFAVKPETVGISKVTFVLIDDMGIGQKNLGSDKSEELIISIAVERANSPPSFSIFKGLVDVMENGNENFHIEQICTNISAGDTTEDGQKLSFYVSVLSVEPDNLFPKDPIVNNKGELLFEISPGFHGSASLGIILQDNGGTVNGGRDLNAGGPQQILIRVWPIPTITEISPQIGNSRGGMLITITGKYLMTEQRLSPQVLIGTDPCVDVIVLGSEILSCKVPSGIGSHDVSILAMEESIVRNSTRKNSFIHGDLLFAGIASALLLAVGPGSDVNSASSSLATVSLRIIENQDDIIVSVDTMTVFDQNIILGGQFIFGGTLTYITGFNGKSIQSLGFNFDGSVTCFTTYKEMLIIGGSFISAHETTPEQTTVGWTKTGGLAAWNGNTVVALSAGAPSGVKCVVSNGSYLYVSGNFADLGKKLALCGLFASS